MTGWYLKIADKEVGPLSAQQLRAMASKGQIGPEDLVRQGDSASWVAARRVRGLLSAAAESSPSSSTPLPAATPLVPSVDDSPGKIVLAPAAQEPADRAQVKRRKRRQRRVLFGGLIAALIVLGTVAVFVINNNPFAPSAKKDSPAPKQASPAPAAEEPAKTEPAKSQSEKDLLESISETVSRPAPEANAQDGDQWLDARRKAIIFGAVQVQIKSVELGQVALSRSSGECLSITVKLSNTDDKKIRQYRSWHPQLGLRLVDDLGNSYRLLAPKLRSELIYPESSIEEVLVFQPPVAKAGYLRLQLPAVVFEEPGIARFEIPASMIKKAGPPVQEPSKPRPSKKAEGDVSELIQDIEELGGGDKDANVGDFESDTQLMDKIEKARQKAEQDAKKRRRRTGG